MLTKTTLLLFLLVFVASNTSAADELTKLSPEPISVYLENGKGSVEIIFAKKAGITPPATKVTGAVSPNSSISEKDIHFEWLTSPTPDNSQFVVARLSVDTQSFIAPATPYQGKIILLWPNAPPTTFDFQILNSLSISFDVYPENVDQQLAVQQPRGITLRIKNTGKSKITNLQMSSLGLVDTATGHKVDTPSKNHSIDLNPTEEKLITYELPHPVLAGAYSGALDITANNSNRKSLAVVLRTRGPSFPHFLFLPFVLFVAVLGLGFWLSSKLDQWFGQGGLQRAQAILRLRRSQADLTEGLRRIQKWQDEHKPARVPRTEVRLQYLIDDLITVLHESDNLPLTQLTTEAQRFASQVGANALFWSFLKIATDKFPAATLPGVAQKLDAVVIPEPPALDVYRDNLLKVLQTEITAAALGGSGEVVPPEPTVISSAAIQKRIRFMARLYQVLVWIVVFAAAYQILYLSDRSFGTLLDYLAVFLWTLGLTQTGTQILARAQSSYQIPK